MDKILVTLVVPSVEEKFDVLIPKFLTVAEVVDLLAEAVADVTQHMYVSSGSEVLCRSNPAMVLFPDRTMQEYGVEHGECLYLF